MKREIIVGVAAALLASTFTYFTTKISTQLSKVKLQEIAGNIVNNDAFTTVLLNELSSDSRFQPQEPENGVDGFRNIVSSGDSSCADLGSTHRICWGFVDLPIANLHTRQFAFKFPSKFSQTPIVTNALNTNSSGFSFNVYSSTVTKTDYIGRLVEISSRVTVAPIKVSYMAIGKR